MDDTRRGAVRSRPFLALLVVAAGVAPAFGQETTNDYPTAVRADYVLGCMAANGESRLVLEQCACAIDHIASVLPYDSYVQAETMLRTLQVGGERVAAMRGSARHNEIVANLRRTQAEADILCFQ
ncbi:MAG: hypothetical protein AAF698_06520 [Pseudomonadota bacterium]